VWPYSSVLGLGDTQICVGTDDEDLATSLLPWAVDEDRLLVDLGLELHPAPPARRGEPRKRPNLRHGTLYLASTDDTAILRSSLLDHLGMLARAVGPAEVRVRAMVLERDGLAYVVPVALARQMPQRRLDQLGFRPHYSLATAVDTERSRVLLGPALGSDSAPTNLPLGGVWLEHRNPNEPTTAAIDAARLIGNLDLAGVEFDAAALLSHVARMVTAGGIHYVAPDAVELEKALTALGGR